jgi:peptidoglycan-N-acetylglucosamine deacetylase
MNFWLDGYQGAVSLTFDDGLESHLRVAIPILDQAGIRATFYLNPRGAQESAGLGDSWMERLAPWVPVQMSGHEMGNHSLSHPCSLNVRLPWQEGTHLLDWTLADIERDVLEAKRRLEAAFPGQKTTSYAYPCYESTVGRGEKRASYTPLIVRNFVAARAKGELRGELANDPRYCDLHHLSSWPVEFQSGALMIGLVEQAMALGRWAVFTFHGIDEGHLTVGQGEFIALVEYLQRRKAEVWSATVAEIGAYVQQKIGGK